VVGRGEAGLFAEARAFEDASLKLDALLVRGYEANVFHEGREGDTAADGGFEAGVVYKVDGPGPRHEIDGGEDDDDKRRAEDVDGVQLKGAP